MTKNLENLEGIKQTSIQEEISNLKKEIENNEPDGDKKKETKNNEPDGNKKEQTEKPKPSPRKVHGLINVGDIVIPDYADIAGPNPAALFCVDASHNTGFGVSAIRINNFNKPENIAATVINPHWDKKFGNVTVSANAEITFIDNAPELNGVTSKVLGAYDAGNGWTFEGTYFHGFNQGPDSDSFRLGITKKINDALAITAQGWYKSDYEQNFFGRGIVDVNLGNGLGVQLSCIRKNGKLEPTAGVLYQF